MHSKIIGSVQYFWDTLYLYTWYQSFNSLNPDIPQRTDHRSQPSAATGKGDYQTSHASIKAHILKKKGLIFLMTNFIKPLFIHIDGVSTSKEINKKCCYTVQQGWASQVGTALQTLSEGSSSMSGFFLKQIYMLFVKLKLSEMIRQKFKINSLFS